MQYVPGYATMCYDDVIVVIMGFCNQTMVFMDTHTHTYLHIGGVSLTVVPGSGQRREYPATMIKETIVEVNMKGCERLLQKENLKMY